MPVWQQGGVRGRLIAGNAFGLSARVRTHSPLFYAYLDMDAGATAPLPQQPERALYVAAGAVEVEGQRCVTDEMAIIGPGPSSLSALCAVDRYAARRRTLGRTLSILELCLLLKGAA